MLIGYKMQSIFWWRHKFLGVKSENDVMWRHMTSSRQIVTKLSQMIFLDDIFIVSKYEAISII